MKGKIILWRMTLNAKSSISLAGNRAPHPRPSTRSRVTNRPKRELMVCLGWLRLFNVIVAKR
jgi:hypothetical protein